MPDIEVTPPFPIAIRTPADDTRFSRPVWVDNGLGQFLLFHRRGMLYAYRTDGTLRWSIKAQVAIMGFAMGDDDGDSLYVQDGPVLCEYALDSLQKVVVKMPSNALAFGQNGPKSWSRDDGDDETSFKALFEGAPATDTYSAPLYFTESGESKVYVLRSDGRVFAAHPDLTPARFPHAGNTGNIPAVPDQPGEPPQPALYLDSSNGPARLCFISGGQVVILPDNRLETPSEGIAAWRQNRLLTMTDQPWMPLVSPAQGFIGSAAPAANQATAVTLLDPAAGTWSFHLVDPSCAPALSNAGSMQVQDQTAGAIVTHSNPGIPAGLVISTPPPQGNEWSGVLPVAEVLSAPYLLEEDGARFVYMIATIASRGSNVPHLCKFKLVALDRKASPATPSDTYVLCWWKAVQSAHDALQPILASEVISILADQTTAAIGNNTLPGTFAQTSDSPLWSATLKGSVPWDKFQPAAPIYVPLSRGAAGTFATPVDTSYQWAATWSSKPAAPLFGPYLVNGQLVLSNRYGLYGFTLQGALAWRIPARVAFQGWMPAGMGNALSRFLLVTEMGLLGAYDTSHFPNDGSAVLCPDQMVQLAPGGVLTNQPSQTNYETALFEAFLPPHPPGTFVPCQPFTDPNNIHLHAGSAGDIAVGFDPSKGLTSGAAPSSFPGGEAYFNVDLNADATKVNWRPASAQLPAGTSIRLYSNFNFMDPGNPKIGSDSSMLTPTAALQINTSAGPIDVCDIAYFYLDPLDNLSLRCCLANGSQYYLAGFPTPES